MATVLQYAVAMFYGGAIRSRIAKFFSLGGLLVLTTLLTAMESQVLAAASVNLAWNPSTDPNVAGYKVYYGVTSHNYTNSVDVGNVTNAVITGLTGGATYYFAATTYNVSGIESDFSNEASYQVTTNSGSSVASPTSASKLTSPTSNNGQFSFQVSGIASNQYVVQASTDLIHWVNLATNTAPFAFVDTNAWQFPKRFYRTMDLSATNATQSSVPAGTNNVLTSPTNSGTSFSFQVNGVAGNQYAVQASTDLIHWVNLATNTAPFVYVDTNAWQYPKRFYRTMDLSVTNAAQSTTTTNANNQLTSPMSRSGQFSFQVAGPTNTQYVVQASTDLVHWMNLVTNTAPFEFVDTHASQFSQRFYRTMTLSTSP